MSSTSTSTSSSSSSSSDGSIVTLSLIQSLYEACPLQLWTNNHGKRYSLLHNILQHSTTPSLDLVKFLIYVNGTFHLKCGGLTYRDDFGLSPLDRILILVYQGGNDPMDYGMEVLRYLIAICPSVVKDDDGNDDVGCCCRCSNRSHERSDKQHQQHQHRRTATVIHISPLLRLLSITTSPPNNSESSSTTTSSSRDHRIQSATSLLLSIDSSLSYKTSPRTGNTPLHVALMNHGHATLLIRTILEYGQLQQQRTSECCRRRCRDLALMMNKKGERPIHVAIMAGVPEETLRVVIEATLLAVMSHAGCCSDKWFKAEEHPYYCRLSSSPLVDDNYIMCHSVSTNGNATTAPYSNKNDSCWDILAEDGRKLSPIALAWIRRLDPNHSQRQLLSFYDCSDCYHDYNSNNNNSNKRRGTDEKLWRVGRVLLNDTVRQMEREDDASGQQSNRLVQQDARITRVEGDDDDDDNKKTHLSAIATTTLSSSLGSFWVTVVMLLHAAHYQIVLPPPPRPPSPPIHDKQNEMTTTQHQQQQQRLMKDYYSTLHAAVAVKCPRSIVKMALLKNFYMIRERDINGYLPLHLALMNPHQVDDDDDDGDDDGDTEEGENIRDTAIVTMPSEAVAMEERDHDHDDDEHHYPPPVVAVDSPSSLSSSSSSEESSVISSSSSTTTSSSSFQQQMTTTNNNEKPKKTSLVQFILDNYHPAASITTTKTNNNTINNDDHHRLLPLHLAIESEKHWGQQRQRHKKKNGSRRRVWFRNDNDMSSLLWQHNVKLIAQAYPEGVERRNPMNGLYPFMQAAATTTTTMTKTTTTTTIMMVDPEMAMGQQQQQQQQRRRRRMNNSSSSCCCSIDTIYYLLRRCPALVGSSSVGSSNNNCRKV